MRSRKRKRRRTCCGQLGRTNQLDRGQRFENRICAINSKSGWPVLIVLILCLTVILVAVESEAPNCDIHQNQDRNQNQNQNTNPIEDKEGLSIKPSDVLASELETSDEISSSWPNLGDQPARRDNTRRNKRGQIARIHSHGDLCFASGAEAEAASVQVMVGAGNNNSSKASESHRPAKRGALGRASEIMDQDNEGPLVVARAGERVELACHMLGLPLRWRPNGLAAKWTLSDQSVALADDEEKEEQQQQQGDNNNNNNKPKLSSERRPVHHLDSLAGNQIIAESDRSLRGANEPADEADLVSLLFWFKDDNPAPIYTIDARQVVLPDKLGELEVVGGGGARTPLFGTPDQHPDQRRPLTLTSTLTPALISTSTSTSTSVESWNETSGASAATGHHLQSQTSSLNQQQLINLANKRLMANARHYPGRLAGEQLTSRLQLDTSADLFPLVRLSIDKAQASDSARYKCRVDFRRSRTVSQVVRLLVKVPVNGLQIKQIEPSEKDEDVTRWFREEGNAPANNTTSEGQPAEFLCWAREGSPSPKLNWLVAWHRFNESGASVWSNWEPMGGQVSASSAVAPPSPPINDLPRSSRVDQPADKSQLFVAAIRLRFDRMTRRFYKAKLGCLASQFQLDSDWKPTLKPKAENELDLSQNEPAKRAVLKRKNQIANPQSSNWNSKQTAAKSTAKMIDELMAVSQEHDDEEAKDGSGHNNESPFKQQQQRQQRLSWLELEVNLGPESVEIVSGNERDKVISAVSSALVSTIEFNEHESAKLVCRSSGSAPAAKLSWLWKPRRAGSLGPDSDSDSALASNSDLDLDLDLGRTARVLAETSGPTNSSTAGFISSSLIEVHALDSRFHLAELWCVATNQALPEASKLASKLRLLVRFRPLIKLNEIQVANELPATTTSVASKSQRRLRCQIQSNPPINQLVWLVNEQPLARIISAAAPLARRLAASASAHARASTLAGSSSAANSLDLSSGLPVVANAAATFGQLDLQQSYSEPANQTMTQLLGNDELLNKKNKNNNNSNQWRLIPLIPSAIDGTKYKLDGHDLLVTMNLTNLEANDEYKCKAINIMGETSSRRVRPEVNYRPICVRHTVQQDKTAAQKPTTRLLLEKLLNMELNQVLTLGDQAGGQTVGCLASARPTPTRFAWWFVPLHELASLSTKLAAEAEVVGTERELGEPSSIRWLPAGKAAEFKLESKSSTLNLLDAASATPTRADSLFAQAKSIQGDQTNPKRWPPTPPPKPAGLLLCKALNEIGWQERACASLLLPPETSRIEPSANECLVKPFIAERGAPIGIEVASKGAQSRASASREWASPGPQLILGVDCSRVRNDASLLFQLAVSRPSPRSAKPTQLKQTSGGQLQLKRLLFGEPMGGSPKLELAVSALLAEIKDDDDDEEEEEQEVEAEGGSDKPGEGARISAKNNNKLGDKTTTTTSIVGLQNDQAKPDGEQTSSPGQRQRANSNNYVSPEKMRPERKRAKEEERSFEPMQRAEKIITLDEQVRLLNELVLTIRASNLIRTSEPRAILGSQLQLPIVDNDAGNDAPKPLHQLNEPNGRGQSDYEMADIADSVGLYFNSSSSSSSSRRPLARSHRPAGELIVSSSSAQVLRSASQADGSSIDMSEASMMAPSLVQPIAASRRNGSSGARLSTPSAPAVAGDQLTQGTIAALCGLALLSGLTLTLIVLVLRVRKGASLAVGAANNEFKSNRRQLMRRQQQQSKRVTFCREAKELQLDELKMSSIETGGIVASKLELEQTTDKLLLVTNAGADDDDGNSTKRPANEAAPLWSSSSLAQRRGSLNVELAGGAGAGGTAARKADQLQSGQPEIHLGMVDFMAPAVCGGNQELLMRGLHASSSNYTNNNSIGRRRTMALYSLEDRGAPSGGNYQQLGSSASMNQLALQADHRQLDLAKETLYVIAADETHQTLESLMSIANHRIGEKDDEEEEEESLRSIPIMCNAKDEHLLTAVGNNGFSGSERRLVGANGTGSYCSSSTCNSSSTHCDELNTLTSGCLANSCPKGLATDRATIASGQLHLCNPYKVGESSELDLVDCYAEEDLSSTTGFGFGTIQNNGNADSNSDSADTTARGNVYLFSFL